MKTIRTAVILSVAVATGGCAAPPAVQQPAGEPTQVAQVSEPARAASGMPPGFVDPSALPELTRTAIDDFPGSLPEGVSWSNAPIHLSSDDADAAIEDSVAEVAIAEYWLCTWMGDYIGAVDAGDQPRADHAMSHLDRYPSLPAIIAHHQNPEVFTRSVLQPATMGDSQPLRGFF